MLRSRWPLQLNPNARTLVPKCLYRRASKHPQSRNSNHKKSLCQRRKIPTGPSPPKKSLKAPTLHATTNCFQGRSWASPYTRWVYTTLPCSTQVASGHWPEGSPTSQRPPCRGHRALRGTSTWQDIAWVMGEVRGRDMLTLQTCTPYPTFEKRLIVRADRV